MSGVGTCTCVIMWLSIFGGAVSNALLVKVSNRISQELRRPSEQLLYSHYAYCQSVTVSMIVGLSVRPASSVEMCFILPHSVFLHSRSSDLNATSFINWCRLSPLLKCVVATNNTYDT